MSKEKKVITIKNEELPISQCKKFEKSYYKIGNINIENSGDCYLIENKYYREETKLIVFNHSIQQYVLKNDYLINGIIGFNDSGFLFGYFSFENNPLILKTKEGKEIMVLNDKVLKGNREYREELSSGIYYHISKLPAFKFNILRIPSNDYKFSLPYDSRGIINHHLDIYNKNYNPEIFPNIEKYTKVLNDLSFGLEFETTKGFIPDRILNKIGLIPLRDGSISGIEYVTVPLEGKKGLQCIVDSLDILKNRTEYNDSCSLHLHLGNVPRTKEFILAFFKLTCAVQDEIFEMFPIYKKYNFKVKNKNYSKPYPVYKLLSQIDNVITDKNINENFNVLYQYLTGGESFNDVGCDLNNVKSHPSDPNGQAKWQIKTRYYIHNLVPLLFGNKKTIEFRIHTPTYDTNKIIFFILINSILVNYTKIHQNEILKDKSFLSYRNILNIISEYLNNSININDNGYLEDSLFQYINKRKSATEFQNGKGLIKGQEEFINYEGIVDFTSKEKLIKPLYTKSPSLKYQKITTYTPYNIELENTIKDFKSKKIEFSEYITKSSALKVAISGYKRLENKSEEI